MSARPHPVALTTAMLMLRQVQCTSLRFHSPEPIASLTSRIHRIAKGATRASLAECNGELWGGQRDRGYRFGPAQTADQQDYFQDVDTQVAKYCSRIDRTITKLNADLAPLALRASRCGDPRGIVLRLCSTDPTKPLPSNCAEAGVWGVL